MTDWQPIETAPKDGTPILCIKGKFIPEVVRWHNGSWLSNDEYDFGPTGAVYEPDHWQQLPDPPIKK